MTDKLVRQLEADRAARDAARSTFEARVAEVKEGFEKRGIGERIADKLGQEARETFDDALDVASQSKGIIAGTVGALALWFFRHPIIAWFEELMEHDGQDAEKAEEGETHSE